MVFHLNMPQPRPLSWTISSLLAIRIDMYLCLSLSLSLSHTPCCGVNSFVQLCWSVTVSKKFPSWLPLLKIWAPISYGQAIENDLKQQQRQEETTTKSKQTEFVENPVNKQRTKCCTLPRQKGLRQAYVLYGWVIPPENLYVCPVPSLTWRTRTRTDFNFPIRIRWQLSWPIPPTPTPSLLLLHNMTFEVIFMWNLLMLSLRPAQTCWSFFFTTSVCRQRMCMCVCVSGCVCVCALFVSCDCLQNSCHLKRQQRQRPPTATEWQTKKNNEKKENYKKTPLENF